MEIMSGVMSDIFVKDIFHIKKVKNSYLKEILTLYTYMEKNNFSLFFYFRRVAGSIYFGKRWRSRNVMRRWKGKRRETGAVEGGKKKPGYYFCSLSVNWNHKNLDRFRGSPSRLTFHSPFVAYYPFVTSQDKRLRWMQSSGVGCNYGLSITNSTHAVTTCPELTRSLLMHWRDKFTPQVPYVAFLSLELIRVFFPFKPYSGFLSLPPPLLSLSLCFICTYPSSLIIKHFHIEHRICNNEYATKWLTK